MGQGGREETDLYKVSAVNGEGCPVGKQFGKRCEEKNAPVTCCCAVPRFCGSQVKIRSAPMMPILV